MKIISVSDLHIGHNKVKSDQITNNFREFVFPQLDNTDIIFFCGDYYEKLQDMDSRAAYDGIELMVDILKLAEKKGFKIRILKGTALHDRNQNRLFNSISKTYKVDFKYIDRLEFEFIEDLDIKILYLPDHLPYKESSDCIAVIKKGMDDLCWDTLDFVIGHGCFEHAVGFMPKFPPCTFNAEQFKKIVSGKILMGHIHTHSAYKNVIYNGSFDRLNHGEEEPKGFVVVESNDKKNYKIKFIENKKASIFLTIDLPFDDVDLNVESTVKSINRCLEEDSNYSSYIRLRHDDATMRQLVARVLNNKYPNIFISSISKKQNKISQVTVSDFLIDIKDTVVPTKDNLFELVSNFIKDSDDVTLSISEIDELLKIL